MNKYVQKDFFSIVLRYLLTQKDHAYPGTVKTKCGKYEGVRASDTELWGDGWHG